MEERIAVRSVSLLVVGRECWLPVKKIRFGWRCIRGRRRLFFVGGGQSGDTGSFAVANCHDGGSTMLANGGQAAGSSPSGPDFGRAASEDVTAA